MVEHNLIIETANEVINKQGKSVMLDFFTNCGNLVNGGDNKAHYVYLIVASE